MKKFLLTMLVVLIALPAFARDFKYEYEGQIITYTVIDEDAKTCKTKSSRHDGVHYYSGNNISGNLILPSFPTDGYANYKLIEIGEGSFDGNRSLTSVIIPNTVTEIKPKAFVYCDNLTSLKIGNSVTAIEEEAFGACMQLTSVDIPNSVTTIGEAAFLACQRLALITIPNSVVSIGAQAFGACEALTEVTIPNSVTEIGQSAFFYCTSLTAITISNSIVQIGSEAFAACNKINSIKYFSDTPIVCSNDIFDIDVYHAATLHYLKSAEEKITTMKPWSIFSHRTCTDEDPSTTISDIGAPNEDTTIYDMRGNKVGRSIEGLNKGIYIIRKGSTTQKIVI